MNPKEQLAQKMIDEATNVYNIGEESNIFNNQKKQKAHQILKDMREAKQKAQTMNHDYKSFPELYRMSVEDLQNELLNIQEHVRKLEEESQHFKNLAKITSHLIDKKTNNGNSKVEVNQIKKRGTNNAS